MADLCCPSTGVDARLRENRDLYPFTFQKTFFSKTARLSLGKPPVFALSRKQPVRKLQNPGSPGLSR